MSKLHSTLEKKCQLETYLKSLEEQIFELETQYLEDTHLTGSRI